MNAERRDVMRKTTMPAKKQDDRAPATAGDDTAYDVFDSPIGPLVVAAVDGAIVHLLLPKGGQPAHVAPEWHRAPKKLGDVRAQLAATLQGVVCQTLVKRAGGKGRAVATEVLIATPAVANLIREGKTYQIPSAMQSGRELGMHTMDQHLAELVNAGDITQEAAVEKVHDLESFKRLVSGGHSTDGVDQLLALRGLHQVPGRAGLHRLQHVVLLAGGRQDQHPRRRVLLQDPRGHLDAVGAGDLQVQHHHLGPRRREACQRLVAVRGDRDHLEPVGR